MRCQVKNPSEELSRMKVAMRILGAEKLVVVMKGL
jgi:hypothetical protein